jgi:hypothetical protein
MPIFFITYHSVPSPTNTEYGNIKGAYINGWVDANNVVEASRMVCAKIEGLDFQVISLEEAKEISKEYFKENPEGLEKYQQALIDKEVYIIHTYI